MDKVFTDAFSGAAGGTVSTLAFCPLDIAKTRRQAFGGKGDTSGKNGSMWIILRRIYSEHGVLGFTHGLQPKLVQNAVMNFGQFYWAAALKTLKSGGRDAPLSTWQSLGLNMLASNLNLATCLPLEVVSTRVQAGTGAGSIWGTSQMLWGEGGMSALYKGLMTSMVLTVNPAINCELPKTPTGKDSGVHLTPSCIPPSSGVHLTQPCIQPS